MNFAAARLASRWFMIALRCGNQAPRIPDFAANFDNKKLV
jgi:hypothetical protein